MENVSFTRKPRRLVSLDEVEGDALAGALPDPAEASPQFAALAERVITFEASTHELTAALDAALRAIVQLSELVTQHEARTYRLEHPWGWRWARSKALAREHGERLRAALVAVLERLS